MPDPREQLKRHFHELYPSSPVALPTKSGTGPSQLPLKSITQEYPSEPSISLKPATPQRQLPKPTIVFQPIFTKINEQIAKDIIEEGQFIGLDPGSIRRLIFRHPRIFLAAISQIILNLILFPYRAGWSALTGSERNTFPWLSASIEWGLTSSDFYHNAHNLPDDHPMKPICLTNARQLAEWEHQHRLIAWYFRDSKPLDHLLGLPIPVGSDGWPVNQLDHQGNPLPADQLYSLTYLFFAYPQPQLSNYLKNLIKKTALDALQKGRLSLIQQ